MTNKKYKLVPLEPTPEMVEAAREHHEGEAYLPASVYKAMLAAAPAVQGEPVGWQFYMDGEWWNGDDRIKDHRKITEELRFRVRDVYAAPQPAPDVAGLVEALDLAIEYWRDRQQRYKNRRPKWVIAAESALAAHRKQGAEA